MRAATKDLFSKLDALAGTIRVRIYEAASGFNSKIELDLFFRYYSSYLVFFTEEIQKYGAGPTLERYLFKYKEGQLLIRYVEAEIK